MLALHHLAAAADCQKTLHFALLTLHAFPSRLTRMAAGLSARPHQAAPNTSACVALHALPGRPACRSLAPTYILQQIVPALTMMRCNRVLDQELFPISNTMSGALVRFEPYAMRQLHWHVNFDEWCGSLHAVSHVLLHCAHVLQCKHEHVSVRWKCSACSNAELGVAGSTSSTARWRCTNPPAVLSEELLEPV